MIILNNDIKQAASLLRAGKLVAFPTETVYGLGGNALSDAAVAAIYAAKGRPSFNPLIVHVPSLEEAQKYAAFNDDARRLAEKFWPGPLTLVLPRRPQCGLSLLVSAGMDTVAIRVPAHPLARELLCEAAIPVAAPSANRSGRISPTEAAHVQEELGNKVDMILDGGACEVGIESTVVDCAGEEMVILRPGVVLFPLPLGEGAERSEAGEGIASGTALIRRFAPPSPVGRREGLRSPGQLASHYAPSKPMRLNATYVHTHEALLAFGRIALDEKLGIIPSPLGGGLEPAPGLTRGWGQELVKPYPNCPLPGHAAIVENLSPSGSLQEAAANLFRLLRKLDASAAASIAVMPIPEEGLGVAINDRLRRAAAPR